MGYQFRKGLNPSLNGNCQLIQAKDIIRSEDHKLDFTQLQRITLKKDLGKYKISNGDIIFLSKGQYNYATFIEDLPDTLPTIAASYFFVLRVKNNSILPEYLAWHINQPPSQVYLQRVVRGSGMPFIPKSEFSNLEIDIPSFDAQKIIIKLYKLSLKEKHLIDVIKYKRNKLLQNMCLKAAKS